MRIFGYFKAVGEEPEAKVFKRPVDPNNEEAGEEDVSVYPASFLDVRDKGLVLYVDTPNEEEIAKIRKKAGEAEIEVHVDTDGTLSVPIIHAIRAGMTLEGGKYVLPACRISWTEANAFIINVGNCTRELLCAVCSSQGRALTVCRLLRIGNLKISNVAPGTVVEYTPEQIGKFMSE